MRLGDAMIIPTLLAYGARWVWLVPVVALAPLALWRRSLGLPLAFALAVWLLGIMQFQVPHLPVARACCRVTVLTLNGNRAARPEAVRQVVQAMQPDVIAMQEWEQTSTASALPGWTVHCDGELCLGSRRPMSNVAVLSIPTPTGHRAMVMSAEITTEAGPVSFCSIHLETVRKGIEPMLHAGFGATDELRDNLVFRDRESRAAASWILAHSAHPAIVAGDFNMPTDSAIYRRNWNTWSDGFESAGTGLGHTKFTSLWGIRIDHVLFDANWRAVSARVGPDVGSDHRPLIVTLQPAPSARPAN
jgi:endonuclease/exonuclease/phosphatase (EEP) superfamily protein YafD